MSAKTIYCWYVNGYSVSGIDYSTRFQTVFQSSDFITFKTYLKENCYSKIAERLPLLEARAKYFWETFSVRRKKFLKAHF